MSLHRLPLVCYSGAYLEDVMAKGKITKRSVESVGLPSTGKRAHLWDETLKGFGLMVTDRGARSYIVQYRVWGRGSPTRRVTIGKHGSPWTAETARQRATELLEQVRRKVDPFDAQREAKSQLERERVERNAANAIKERLAFDAVAARYLDSPSAKKLRTWRDVKSVIDRDLLPVFASMPLPDISPADISDLLNDVAKRGDGPARAAYSAMSAVLRYAAEKETRYFKASNSPLRDVTAPAPSIKRQRLLSGAEIRLVWQSAGGLGWPFCDIVRLLLLTGQRLREVAEARWTEFDLAKGEWLIPGERTKNKLPMVVHLSAPVLAILEALPHIASKKQFLFSTTGETPVSGFSRSKARLDAIINKALSDDELEPMESWRLHDLRRSMSTNCQRLGISPEVVDLMQNHVEGARSGTRGSYQLYKYAAERKTGFNKWGSALLRIVEPKHCSKVIPMRGAA